MKTILLVDGDDKSLNNIAGHLNKAGFAVIGMQNGAAALYSIRHEMPIDLVISAWHIEGMTGLEMLAAVKKSAPLMPIIMMTADETIEAYLKALSLSAFEYLNKPVKPQELVRIVKSALELKDHHDTSYQGMLLKHTA